MENPYTWPQALVDEWLLCLREVGLNRYPDPQASLVKRQLREVMGIPETQDIILGNGSDELIQIITMAVAEADRVVLAPEPSFVMYRLIATLTGMRFIGVPLQTPGFGLDMQAMKQGIERYQPAVVFLAYPNNPTGNLWPRKEVEEILSLAPGLVVVDEAYAPFASDSFIDSAGRYDNLVVMRTVSKMGLAGLRLGLVTGSADWLTHFNKVRLPYNINVLTQVTVEFALRHRGLFDEQAARIRQDRQLMFERLNTLPGIEPFPSEANFILFRTPASRADEIFEEIKRQGVLIKNLSGQDMLGDCLRVTVGKPEENELFLRALGRAL
jgi:histidinol-phosphate aminotransferase